MSTLILKCNCDYVYQDEKYGLKQRLHNITKGGNARCTVCGNMKLKVVEVPKEAKNVKQ